jgi:hypothetical protein
MRRLKRVFFTGSVLFLATVLMQSDAAAGIISTVDTASTPRSFGAGESSSGPSAALVVTPARFPQKRAEDRRRSIELELPCSPSAGMGNSGSSSGTGSGGSAFVAVCFINELRLPFQDASFVSLVQTSVWCPSPVGSDLFRPPRA